MSMNTLIVLIHTYTYTFTNKYTLMTAHCRHLKTLFYYQILRNGNTNILQHLARFAALYKNLQGCNGMYDNV